MKQTKAIEREKIEKMVQQTEAALLNAIVSDADDKEFEKRLKDFRSLNIKSVEKLRMLSRLILAVSRLNNPQRMKALILELHTLNVHPWQREKAVADAIKDAQKSGDKARLTRVQDVVFEAYMELITSAITLADVDKCDELIKQVQRLGLRKEQKEKIFKNGLRLATAARLSRITGLFEIKKPKRLHIEPAKKREEPEGEQEKADGGK